MGWQTAGSTVDCVPEAIEGCRGIFSFEARPSPFAGACRGGTGVELTVESALPGRWQSDCMRKNPELIVVTRELGCSIVPIDPQDRKIP